jgi:GntR family transcriptional regulator
METQRLIHRRQGRGTFVNDPSSGQLARRFCSFRGADGNRVQGEVASVEVSEATASDEERRALQLGEGDPVYRISRVHIHNDRPFMVEDATVPGALFPGLATGSGSADSIVGLAGAFGVLLGHAHDRVSVALPTTRAATALSVASGTPLLRRERIVCLLDGLPVEWGIAQCHLVGGHYQAEIN